MAQINYCYAKKKSNLQMNSGRPTNFRRETTDSIVVNRITNGVLPFGRQVFN